MTDISAPITSLPGIGPGIALKLFRLNITSVFDLLYHLPFRYEDRSLIYPISDCRIGEVASIKGFIKEIKNDRTKKGQFIEKAIVTDKSGEILVIWFNQFYLTKTLKKDTPVNLYGKVDFFAGKIALINPEYEIVTSGVSLNTGRIVPVYPETAGVTSKWLRAKIYQQLVNPEIMEEIIPNLTNFPSWKKSLFGCHFPQNLRETEIYKKRLDFDRMLLYQLSSLTRRKNWQKVKVGYSLQINMTKISEFINNLPFKLTSTQQKSIGEILIDLGKKVPMNRLLEGDVGSGKTVVAAVAVYTAYLNGYKSLFLSPTQILAAQHFRTLNEIMKNTGLNISLITASTSKSKKTLEEIQNSDLIIGTHALFSRKFDSQKVGLVVIDEQHRFGVLQRSMAVSLGQSPHILTMTATPIPRTVALTVYGDLDLSYLDNLPQGRLPVKTWVVPEIKRPSAYGWIAGELKARNTQAFIICPFIEESETMSSVKAASTEYSRLKSVFPGFNLGLLHGRLKPAEKDLIMSDFKNKKLDILVSTPIVEVGIDIPNASIMVIEAADRFGLAQLHQLRGRVGRGKHQSYCLLFSESQTERLKNMESIYSGRILSEIDLKLRGPGQIFGTAQHGRSVVYDIGFSDPQLVSLAQKWALTLFPGLDSYPLLKSLLKTDKMNAVLPN